MNVKHLALSVVAALAAAACADQGPTALPSSGDGLPRLSTVAASAVTPRLVVGNIAGEGNAVCMDLAVNPSRKSLSGVKIDPPRNATIAGYSFTLSANGQLLSFTRVQPGYDIVAVVVKGGNDTFIYEYPAGTTSGTALQSPPKNDKVPQISHYSVCFTPTPPPMWTIEKKVLGYYDSPAMTTFKTGDEMTFRDGCVLDAALSTRAECIVWIKYEITATKIGGSPNDPPAVLTDDIYQRCADLFLGSGQRIQCEYAEEAPFTTTTTTTTKTWVYWVDVWNRNDCMKQHKLKNTVTLTVGGKTISDDATFTLNTGACAAGVRP
jgi:hypothetical protein